MRSLNEMTAYDRTAYILYFNRKRASNWQEFIPFYADGEEQAIALAEAYFVQHDLDCASLQTDIDLTVWNNAKLS